MSALPRAIVRKGETGVPPTLRRPPCRVYFFWRPSRAGRSSPEVCLPLPAEACDSVVAPSLSLAWRRCHWSVFPAISLTPLGPLGPFCFPFPCFGNHDCWHQEERHRSARKVHHHNIDIRLRSWLIMSTNHKLLARPRQHRSFYYVAARASTARLSAPRASLLSAHPQLAQLATLRTYSPP